MTKDNICSSCKQKTDYICHSGLCVPCERKRIGEDGIEVLRTIFELTQGGKYSVPTKLVIDEHQSRLDNK